MLFKVSILVCWILLGCAQEKSTEPMSRKAQDNSDAIAEGDGSGEVNPPQQEENAVHPKLLFHGGGGLTPSSMKDMSRASQALVSLGVAASNIHIIRYPDTKNISDIKAAVSSQLQTIFSQYPANTKFDSIGHSLGLLASFISLAELGHLPKMRALIGVTGVLMRQDESAMPFGCRKGNTQDLCGDIFDRVVGSTDSTYILDLLSKNATELSRIKKCSIWTTQDGILSPPNAGVFPNGISIEMPKSWCTANPFLGKLNPNPCHLKSKDDPIIYQTMKEKCFAGDLK